MTVIIPVFNGERTLARAIESVLCQEMPFSLELILVNDGSSDKTPIIMEEFAQSNSAIQIISHVSNLGKGTAVRSALESSTGFCIQILDADDCFYSQDKLKLQAEALRKNSDVFAVAHPTLVVDVNGQLELLNSDERAGIRSYDSLLESPSYYHTSALMFRKSFDLPAFFLKESFRGDHAFFLYHLLRSKGSLVFLDQVLSIYFVSGEGIWSGSSASTKEALTLDLYQTLLDWVQKEGWEREQEFLRQRIHKIPGWFKGERSWVTPADVLRMGPSRAFSSRKQEPVALNMFSLLNRRRWHRETARAVRMLANMAAQNQ